MGLFDNLFLDANTPLTINDGVDHSKDVVQTIVDPSSPPPGGTTTGGGATGDDGKGSGKDDSKKNDPKKDETLNALFEADKKEELDAEKALTPEPPKDIALEIGHAPDASTSGTNNESPISFDIGGDLSFDIGGDIPGVSDGPSSSGVVSEGAQIEATSPEINIETPTGDLTQSSDPAPTISGIQVESTENTDAPSLVQDQGSSEVISSNDTLYSLLNTSSNPAIETGEAVSIDLASNSGSDLTILGDTPSTVTEGAPSSIFPSLLDETPQVIDGVTPEAAMSVESADTLRATPTPITSESVLPSSTSIISDLPESTLPSASHAEEKSIFPILTDSTASVTSEMTELSSSNKLKSKLTQFLSELESLEVGDESQKAHKLEQIEMCRMRIAEIRAEYESRIHALHVEIEALEQEVREMEGEKAHIRVAIETFQKELEHV